MGSGTLLPGTRAGVILCFEIPLSTATAKPLPGPQSRAQLQMHNSPYRSQDGEGLGLWSYNGE
jgi:hypothetical protein